MYDTDKQKTDYVIVCYPEISFLSNSLKKSNIDYNLDNVYKHIIYNDK